MVTLMMTICSVLVSTDCRIENMSFMPYMAVGEIGKTVTVEIDVKAACDRRAQHRMADPKKRLLKKYEYVKRWTCKEQNQIASRV